MMNTAFAFSPVPPTPTSMGPASTPWSTSVQGSSMSNHVNTNNNNNNNNIAPNNNMNLNNNNNGTQLGLGSQMSFLPDSINFRPISPVFEDPLILLSVRNLPTDISLREFHVAFTFARDFVFCEINQLSFSEELSSSNLMGKAYFRSVQAATDAMSVLDSRTDVFVTRHSNAIGVSHSPLKCELIRPHEGPHKQHSNGSISSTNSNATAGSLQQNSSSKLPPAKSSTFNGLPSGVPPPLLHHSASTGSSVKMGGSRFSFSSINPNDYTSILSPGDHHTSDPFLPSPPSVFNEQTRSTSMSSLATPRATGKSVLLESSKKDAEEYDDIVKDPVGWLSRGNSQSLLNPSSSSSAPNSASTTGPTSAIPSGPSQWNNSRSRSASFNRAFSGLSLNTNNHFQQQQPPSQHQQHHHAPPPLSAGLSGPQNALPSPSPPGGDQYSPTSSANTTNIPNGIPNGQQQQQPINSIQALQNGGRVLPPANPADQHPPCNTLYVGNLPMNTSEEELKALFSRQRGYKRLCFRTKANGPMCFVEFEDVAYATRALTELYGRGLSNSVKGGIRLSFSKNPLGVRSNSTSNNASHANNQTQMNYMHGGPIGSSVPNGQQIQTPNGYMGNKPSQQPQQPQQMKNLQRPTYVPSQSSGYIQPASTSIGGNGEKKQDL